MTSIELEPSLTRRVAIAPRLDLLGISAAAWIGLVVWSRSMGNGPGTMGLGIGAFVGAWTVMMAAMMLPAVTIPGITQSSSLGEPAWRQHAGTLLFAVPFIAVWAVLSIPAYWAARGTAHAAGTGFGPRLVAVVVFVVYAGFQWSPVKARLLGRCWSIPHSHDNHEGLGKAADSGLRYGLTCVACSWATMGLMFAFGLMSVGGMAILAAVIYAERRWAHQLIPKAAGLVGLAYGVSILMWPGLAPGLRSAMMAMHTAH
jgi:predicted metal-binding membrane protein